jgi:hypothetical protein
MYTTLVVTINKNAVTLTLEKRLENVTSIKLKYFKMVAMPFMVNSQFAYPPDMIYIEFSGITQDQNNITHPQPIPWTSFMKAPPSHLWPLQYRPWDQALSISNPLWASYTVEGHQDPCFEINDLRVLHNFQIRLWNRELSPLPFETDTIAQFTFEVHYEDKKDLNPTERIHLYSKHQV